MRLLASFLSNRSLAPPTISSSSLKHRSVARISCGRLDTPSTSPLYSTGCNLNFGLGYTPISRGVSCASGSVRIYKTVPPKFTTFIAPSTPTTTTTTTPLTNRRLRAYASKQASPRFGPYHERSARSCCTITTIESPNTVSNVLRLDRVVVDHTTDAAIVVFYDASPSV